jgi:GT2 family glycosyltransferase
MTSVAVVIPTYNNLPELRLCLKALSQQSYKDFVAYVCVDGSTDGTLEYLRSQPYEFVKVLTHPDGRNHGRNAARNLALPYLHQHRWVAFLDSDSIPLPNWLESFCTSAKENEVLIGKILYYAPFGPNPWNSYRLWRSNTHRKTKERMTFKHFCTISAFLSAAVFQQVGGFDPAIRRHGLGDVELGWRLQNMGLRFSLIAEAKVWSASQHTPAQALLRYYEMGRVNLPFLYRKHPGIQEHLYGGRWLTKPFYKFVAQVMYFLVRPSWVYSLLDRVSTWLQVRFLHYLVLYAIMQGYKHKRLPSFLRR